MGRVNINLTRDKFDVTSSLIAGRLNIFIVSETKKVHSLETSFQPTCTNLT